MPDTVVRDGWAIGVAVYLNPFPPGSVGALHSEACVVVTGRTAQDVTRLLREPTDEDIERAAIALYVFDFDSWELESDGMRDHYRWWARKAIAAYRSPEEADRA
jgi:hypothetical protein